MPQIALETETTGLKVEDGHRIIEVGCIELINRKITGRYYHQYINPQHLVEEGAFAVHGLSNEFLEPYPPFVEIAQAFLDFIDGTELIIHNAPFDMGFINHEFSLIVKGGIDHYSIVDTLVLARRMHPGQRNSLDSLCKRYGVDNSQRDLHGARLDAQLLAQVYLAMTGGQGSLFDESRSPYGKVLPEQTGSTASVVKARKLTVLKANTEELALHKARLEKIPNCLWEVIPSR
jgi:DNA polymerase-3 subunit epsilon